MTLETSMGTVEIELFAERAPISVANFLAYVESGFYDGTSCHRVVADFVIQCGGFTPELFHKPTRPPIASEAGNGLRNERGTIAMARRDAVDSATSQFFINLKSNPSLDHGQQNFGYAVFGRVVGGMDVVDAIAAVPTAPRNEHAHVPVEAVVIVRATASP